MLVNLLFENAQLGPPLWHQDHDKYQWHDAKERPTCKERQESIVDNVQFLFCVFKGRHRKEGENSILRITDVSNLKVVGCLFSFAGKAGSGEMYGVHLQNCHGILLFANTIADLYEEKWGSVAGLVAEFCSGRISNNLIVDIHEDEWDSAYGIWIKEPRGLEISRNTIRNISSDDWKSTYGICINGKGSASIAHNLVDELIGEGWTAPVYGIYADTTMPSITLNNVSNLALTGSGSRGEHEMIVPYFGTGGAQNSTESPLFMEGSLTLAGPPILLSEGKNSLGAFSGERISVVVPEGIVVCGTSERKPGDAKPSSEMKGAQPRAEGNGVNGAP